MPHYRGEIDPACPVRWSHPINRGRLAWWLVVPNSGWRGGVTWRDLCRKRDATLTNGPLWAGSGGRPGGLGSVSFDGSDDYGAVAGSVTLTSATFACWARIDLTSTPAYYGVLFSRGGGGSTSGMSLSNNAQRLGYSWNDDQYDWLGGPLLPTSNTWGFLCVVVTPTDVFAYVGTGGQLSSGTQSHTHTSTTLAALSIGRDSFASRNIKGYLDDVSLWNRALSAGEVAQLYTLSRRGYPGLVNRLYLPWAPSQQAAGGGDTTIAADAGAYTLTGSAVTLRQGHKLPAAAGSYALSGTAAGLKRGYPLGAGAGSYALNGQGAGLAKGSKVPAAAGSYSLTGTAVVLTPSVLLRDSFSGASAGVSLDARAMDTGPGWEIVTGSWSDTGAGAAQMTASVADAVAVAESGTGDGTLTLDVNPNAAVWSAGLTFRYQDSTHFWVARWHSDNGGTLYLNEVGGAGTSDLSVVGVGGAGTIKVVMNGTSIKLSWNGVQLISATSSEFQSATKHGLYLSNASGTASSKTLDNFNMTASTASGAVLVAGAGSYLLSGSAAALRAAKNIAAAAGSYLLGGQSVALRKGPVLGVTPGAFSLVGSDVALRWARALGVGSGGYALSGQPVSLRRNYPLSAGIGSYALSGQPVMLRAARRLPAGVGIYALSGRPVTLTWSGLVIAVPPVTEIGLDFEYVRNVALDFDETRDVVLDF